MPQSVMPLAFRKIDHKILWSKEPIDDEERKWLLEGELRADALVDIKTKGNRLSIYLVDEAAGITKERLVGALAAKGEFVGKVDYVVFDLDILNELHIDVDAIVGETPDQDVNTCHRDLMRLTARKLADIANALYRRGEVKRLNDREVGRLINFGVRAGHIQRQRMLPTILAKLQDAKYAPIVGHGSSG